MALHPKVYVHFHDLYSDQYVSVRRVWRVGEKDAWVATIIATPFIPLTTTDAARTKAERDATDDDYSDGESAGTKTPTASVGGDDERESNDNDDGCSDGNSSESCCESGSEADTDGNPGTHTLGGPLVAGAVNIVLFWRVHWDGNYTKTHRVGAVVDEAAAEDIVTNLVVKLGQNPWNAGPCSRPGVLHACRVMNRWKSICTDTDHDRAYVVVFKPNGEVSRAVLI